MTGPRRTSSSAEHLLASSGMVRARYCWDPRLVKEAHHEEVQTGEGNHVHSELAEIAVGDVGKRREQVGLQMAADTKWLRSP